jgi:hypothetical protein
MIILHNTKERIDGHQRLTPVILGTQEAEISKIGVQSQFRQTVLQILSPNKQNNTG